MAVNMLLMGTLAATGLAGTCRSISLKQGNNFNWYQNVYENGPIVNITFYISSLLPMPMVNPPKTARGCPCGRVIKTTVTHAVLSPYRMHFVNVWLHTLADDQSFWLGNTTTVTTTHSTDIAWKSIHKQHKQVIKNKNKQTNHKKTLLFPEWWG